MKILDIRALQILDSRSNPTLQVEVLLSEGSKGIFKVPSGASTGIHEAHELRDGNMNAYGGKGVENCISNIEEIKEELTNRELNQEELDNLLIGLDGTENKTNLGANTILGISCAFAKASAQAKGIKLHQYLKEISNVQVQEKQPTLFANIINGGLHSGNDLQIQEFMIIPLLEDINTNVRAISEIYNTLKKLIEKKYGKAQTAIGDEGGFAPNIGKPSDALDLITDAIKQANYEGSVKIALDAAASDFYNKEKRVYEVEKGVKLDYKKLTEYYNDLVEKYPIISIEDPMDEDDFEGFAYYMKNGSKLKELNSITNKKELMIVGDDLTVTNPKRIEMAVKGKLCNTLLLKINQIGTITESLKANELANKNGWQTIVSHRSGETTDTLISDLAVALSSSIKLGAPARGERVAKYNRLLEIYRD